MSDRTKLTYLFPWEYSQLPLTPPAPDEENSVCAEFSSSSPLLKRIDSYGKEDGGGQEEGTNPV